MNCAAIMTKAPLIFRGEECVADAAARLVAHGFSSAPVVDEEGRYAGMFGIQDLLSLLVPRVALAGSLTANLRFMSDDAEELRRRFQNVKNRRVSDVADRNCATLDPDSSETEAIHLFCRTSAPLPVLERETGKVLGVVSCWGAIRAIAGLPG